MFVQLTLSSGFHVFEPRIERISLEMRIHQLHFNCHQKQHGANKNTNRLFRLDLDDQYRIICKISMFISLEN